MIFPHYDNDGKILVKSAVTEAELFERGYASIVMLGLYNFGVWVFGESTRVILL